MQTDLAVALQAIPQVVWAIAGGQSFEVVDPEEICSHFDQAAAGCRWAQL